MRTGPRPISDHEISDHQQAWAACVVEIGQAARGGATRVELETLAAEAIDGLYAFDLGPVLFKPTRAEAVPFRPTRQGAISYFIGGDVVEDAGFALQPWAAVRFLNDQLLVLPDSALAMGHYVFTDARTGTDTVAEYTFGYRRDPRGDVRAHLHHSSVPFAPERKPEHQRLAH